MKAKNIISSFLTEVILKNYSDEAHDELEAYPLRLNVAALPERRFFKMIRTLTVAVVLSGAVLIILAVFLNYQITHLDISVGRPSRWQFYRMDPQEKTLRTIESSTIRVNALKLLIEAALRDYLIMRNSTSLSTDVMEKNFSTYGRIAQFSSSEVFGQFSTEKSLMLSKIRGKGKKLIREAHIYDLRLVNSNMWMAIIEVFDMPVTEDSVGVCRCSDNSKECLTCKIQKAKNRERYKIWIRTSLNPRKAFCNVNPKINENLCFNPLGITVEKYIPTKMPIHEQDVYWNLPPALRPNL